MPRAKARVRTGLDVLVAEKFRRLRSKRVGLLVHAASVNRDVEHAVDLMLAAGVNLTRLFGPEHGLWATAQDMIHVRTERDRRTGLRVVSLYGKTYESLRPSARELRDLDVLVVDLQDIGTRFYTFAYTAAFAMHAAAAAGVPVMVLDRPNPIGGLAVEGNTVDVNHWKSFVGEYPLCVRHGLTLGELCLLFNGALRPAGEEAADLEVVWMDGWRRAMSFVDTGLPWVLPSPNMPSPTTALVYPGGCLYEGTELSEGRGTTRPFELVGAPWLDPHRLAAALNDENLPGVRFRPLYFRPTFHKHAGVPCGGVQLHITDERMFPSFLCGLAVIKHARAQAPRKWKWRRRAYEFVGDRLAMDLLLGRDGLRRMLERNLPLRDIASTWNVDQVAFGRLRRTVLRYV